MKTLEELYTSDEITGLAKERFKEERSRDHLEGWFFAKEIERECDKKFAGENDSVRIAKTQAEIMKNIPLSISDYSVFVGTMDDSFSRSYSLINPAFRLETFTGYDDPLAAFSDTEPRGDLTKERIESLKQYQGTTKFSKELAKAYELCGDSTTEAIFFIQQVTGHLIPDVRALLANGVKSTKEKIDENSKKCTDSDKKSYYTAMSISLDALLILADRYKKLAEEKEQKAALHDKPRFKAMVEALEKVPLNGAENLYEAIQFFLLIWQTMCLEQTPNPYAFSVGNADRIFEPFRAKENNSRDYAVALFKHFLVFFNVGDRSWAISQNIIVGGKDINGNDLTNPTSYALLDAYYDMNLPQPILSVKLHKNTPEELYKSLGRFFFTPGCLTPSLFNDDSIFTILKSKSGVDDADLADYSVAGCQEPLIMGKDNGNTVNSWINLAKILELTLTGGISEITGKKLGPSLSEMGYADGKELLSNLREAFYKNLEQYTDKMANAANAASRAISLLKVPFLSTMMGGIDSGVDVRDAEKQGTKYNGSGCLIHGLSVVADSFIAIDALLKEHPNDVERLIKALKTNFENDEEMHRYLLSQPKYGNNIEAADKEAAELTNRICDIISSKNNYLGNAFRCDYATPSTHLLYGYWVGATPDGRKSREMLNYGIDPLYGDAHNGLGFRILSYMRLPFLRMNGGCACHLGIDPVYFKKKSYEDRGIEFAQKVLRPLFFNDCEKDSVSPFYLYVNVTTPEMLRKVLAEPKKYAPSGVYIVRIHGTFVNFLDLSPQIQEDIIKRLDPNSTSITI